MSTAAALLFLATAGMLYFILRYRVHIHVTYTRPAARQTSRRRQVRTAATVPDVETVKTITSALVNLGASRRQAQAAAEHAVRAKQGTGQEPFAQTLRRAIQYSQEAA